MAGGPSRPGTVIIPWYATGFRGNALAEALNEVAPVALRYGADSYAVYRSRDDKYRFQQLAHFQGSLEWERYWEGPEMIELRTRYQGSYQVPVLYGWWDLTARGGLLEEPSGGRAGAGHANGAAGNGAAVGDIT
jgi:hypothetical protein